MHEGGVPPGPGLDVRVFGPLVAWRDGAELRLGGPKERAVLATLLAADGEAVSVDGLAESVWGEDQPRSAVRTLHAYVARLRKSLAVNGDGAELLVTRGRSYQLVVPSDAVDARRFVAAANLGRSLTERSDPGAALAACDRALAEWGGPAYAGHEDIDRCAAAARSLDEVRRGLVEDRFEALLALGQADQLVPELEAAVGEEPLRERRWGQLMIALYRAGRQADALRAFQRAREALVGALGVEPGPELRDLEAAILAHDDARLRSEAGIDQPVVALPAALDAAGGALLGRTDELDLLLGTWRDLRSGRGSYVSVVGPEGIGKTRLVAELAAHAHTDGAVICFARCDPDHRSARAVFDQALRSAGSSLMRVQADARIGEPLGATIARRLGEWAATTPVLLVVDDLHEAETEVLEVVADVAGSTRTVAALVVAMFRTEPGDGTRRTGTERQLVVGPLERDAVQSICALYGDAWTAADIDDINTESAGVPLHVHEVATSRAREAAVRRVDEAAGHAQQAEARLSSSREAVADEVVGIQRVIEQHRMHLAPRVEPAPTTTVCPYRGLQTFGTADADWFFGRERLVAEVVARLVTRPVLCLVGASGSGKSSLLLAGVLPALAEGVLPGSEAWRVVVATPGSTSVAEVRARIDEAGAQGTRVVVVLDQMEELFTTGDDANPPAELSDLLVELTEGGGVLLTAVRADQLANVTEVPGLARLLGGNTLLVGAPTGRELSDAIVRPAQRAGLVVEDGLAEEILADAQGATGVLPLVQTALLETWARRRGDVLGLSGYHEAGGVSGAVARQAEAVYARLTEPQQAAARRILLRLAEVADDGALDLRRRVPIADVAGLPASDARVAFDAMVEQRLLTLGEDTVEVTHEALLRAWPRLREWLEADVEGRRVHHRLEDAAREWETGARDPSDLLRGSRLSIIEEWATEHRDDLSEREHDYLVASQGAAAADLTEARAQADRERRTSARLRRLLVGTGVLLALALLAGTLALYQRGMADDAADEARVAQEAANANSLSADASRLSAQALVDPRLDRALLTAVAAVELEDSPDTRAGLIETVQRMPRALRLARLPGEARPQRAVLTPDGRYLAVSDNRSMVRVLEADTLAEVGRTAGVSNFAMAAPEGDLLALGVSFERRAAISVVEIPSMREVLRFDADPHTRTHTELLAAVSVGASADGQRFSGLFPYTNGERVVRVWDAADPDQEIFDRRSPRDAPIQEALLTADGSTVVLVYSDRVELVHVDTGVVRSIPGDHGPTAAISADGRYLASEPSPATQSTLVQRNGELPRSVVNVRDLTTGEALPELSVPASMSTLAFAPTGHVLAVGTNDGTEIWELPDVRRVAVLAGQATSTGGAAVDSTGARAYSVSLDGTVVRWDVDARSSIFQRVDARMDRLVPGATLRDWGMMGPNGDAYYILQDRVAIRDGETGELRDPILLPDHPSAPGSAAIHAVTESPDGTRIAVGTGWGVTWLFDRDSGEQLARWDTADEDWRSVRSVAFTSDGERLAVGLSNDTLQRPDGTYPAPREDVFLLDGHTLEPVGDPIEVPQTGVSGITELAFDPSGEQLLVQHHRDWVGDWGERTPAPVFVAVYDVETGGRKWRSSADSLGMAWSPDGRQIVIGGGDGRIQLLDAKDGETLVGPVEAHDGFAEDVSYSPDGKLVLSAGTDSKVRLWSASELSPSGTFTPTEGSAGGEAARFIGSGSTVRMLLGLQVWSASVDPAALGAHVCSVLGRELTADEWSALAPSRPAPTLCN